MKLTQMDSPAPEGHTEERDRWTDPNCWSCFQCNHSANQWEQLKEFHVVTAMTQNQSAALLMTACMERLSDMTVKHFAGGNDGEGKFYSEVWESFPFFFNVNARQVNGRGWCQESRTGLTILQACNLQRKQLTATVKTVVAAVERRCEGSTLQLGEITSNCP